MRRDTGPACSGVREGEAPAEPSWEVCPPYSNIDPSGPPAVAPRFRKSARTRICETAERAAAGLARASVPRVPRLGGSLALPATRRYGRGACALVAGILIALSTGCAQHRRAPARDDERLPPYAWTDEQTALRDLAGRAAAVRTVSAACDLTLTRPDGESVRLDGAVVLAPPDRLRLRAWKFSRAVFDLTLRPDGLWVLAPDDAGRRRQVLPAALDAATFGREWAFLFGGFFTAPDLEAHVRGDELVVRRTLPDGRSVACDVDRATLTPRRYRMLDPAGRTRFTLVLEGYREFESGVTFPTHFTATSDEGGIDVALRDVELNQPPPADAFVPPRRAERQP